MNIKVFQSGKGDCILITSNNKNILVDGGVSEAYTTHVSEELSKLKKPKISLDLACVSHIDDDHIGGFLKMIEDLVDWRVFDFQNKNGNKNVKKPASFRPPEIKEIWHNAFHDVAGDNNGEIENMLAASANILSASTNPILQEMGEIAFSKGQAIQLSRRLKPEQLNIQLNAFFNKKLAMYRDNTATKKLGKLKIHIIAPFEQDLKNLRTEWNDWLKDNKTQVTKIKDKVDKDRDSLGTSTTPEIAYYSALAEEWEPTLLLQLSGLEASAKKLGVRTKVTTPNLASIMFLIEEGKKTLLMTGDGHWEDILKGLKKINKIDDQNGLHLDVLKVQHHGSEHNISEEFCNKITATNYIFCGNGEHENPDLDAVQAIIDSRTIKPAITGQAAKQYFFWFNSSSKANSNAKAQTHMKKLEDLMKKSKAKFPDLNFKFLASSKSFFELAV
jgi:beta-lactamase superfamily II metal-dependent hydrolase